MFSNFETTNFKTRWTMVFRVISTKVSAKSIGIVNFTLNIIQYFFIYGKKLIYTVLHNLYIKGIMMSRQIFAKPTEMKKFLSTSSTWSW